MGRGKGEGNIMRRIFLPGIYAGYQVMRWLAQNAPNGQIIRVRFAKGSIMKPDEAVVEYITG